MLASPGYLLAIPLSPSGRGGGGPAFAAPDIANKSISQATLCFRLLRVQDSSISRTPFGGKFVGLEQYLHLDIINIIFMNFRARCDTVTPNPIERSRRLQRSLNPSQIGESHAREQPRGSALERPLFEDTHRGRPGTSGPGVPGQYVWGCRRFGVGVGDGVGGGVGVMLGEGVAVGLGVGVGVIVGVGEAVCTVKTMAS